MRVNESGPHLGFGASPPRNRSSQITIDLDVVSAKSTSTLLMKFVAVYGRQRSAAQRSAARPDHLIALLATTTGLKFMDGRSAK